MKSVPKVRISLLAHSLSTVMAKLAEAFERHGDVVQLTAEVPIRVFCFRKPEHIKQLYSHKSMALLKPPNLIKKADWLMGWGTFNHFGGDEWRRKRRLIDPVFERRGSEALCRAVPAVVERTFPRLDAHASAGQPVDVYWEMRRLVADLSFEAFFSTRLGPRLDQVCDDTAFAESMFITLSPLWLPLLSNLRYRRTARRFHALMQQIIGERRAAAGNTPDVLSHLIDATDAELGRKWTDKEIQDELFSVYFGASAMSTALTWTLFLLSKHPPAVQKLREELSDAVGGRNPCVDDLDRLPYLGMVTDESSRLYPPFWGSLRYCPEPVAIDDYTFPARSMFVALRYFAQRHPGYWDNPEAFYPERFAPENRANFHPVAFLPFGAGPRSCLGRHVAPLICQLVIAMLVQRYNMYLRPRFPNDPLVEFSFGVYPKDRVMMTIHKQDER